MKYQYPVLLTLETDYFSVSFPDFPEGVTMGMSVEGALVAAADCLEEMLVARVHSGESIPTPSEIAAHAVQAPLQLVMKLALYEAFMASKLSVTGLAQKLRMHDTEMRRVLNPCHPTKLPRMELALAAFGKRVVIEVLDAATVQG